MELSQQFLIDMALNVGGYLLAGALGIVVWSLFTRRKPAVANAIEEVSVDEAQAGRTNEAVESSIRKLEFIKLGSASEPKPTATREASEGVAERRDRADIIRVARTMLKAGATHEKIKRVIPISEAELSLLTMSKS
jgi:hypothetical protein